MRGTPRLLFKCTLPTYANKFVSPPVIDIVKSTFYRQCPSSLVNLDGTDSELNPALFPNLTFSLPSSSHKPRHWCILGPSSSGKTTLLEVLRGQHLCIPSTGRTFPYLSSDELLAKDKRLRSPVHAIHYVGFNGERGGLGGSGARGAYLSARYESRREETDFSVNDYLQGFTDLNPTKAQEDNQLEDSFLKQVIASLTLQDLLQMPLGNLSNGQLRRARIAKALLGKPEVLLLDEPFMGLDSLTLVALSPLLHRLAKSNSPRLVLTLRPQDPIPDWITHLIYLDQNCQVAHQGTKQQVLNDLRNPAASESHKKQSNIRLCSVQELGRTLTSNGIVRSRGGYALTNRVRAKGSEGWRPRKLGVPDRNREKLIEMKGVQVRYGEKVVLGNWEDEVDGETRRGLWWTVRRGDRWGVFGPNGSGKTTALSLICSDHPQTYSLPICIFGRPRLPQSGQPGISIFDIQSRIGHSSPEIHAFFPRSLTIRQTLENAWADTFLGRPQLNHDRDRKVDGCLRWFKGELNPSSGQSPDGFKQGLYQANSSLDSPYDVYHKGPSESRGARREKPGKARDIGFLCDEIESTDLDWADSQRFGEIPFSAQRVALLLRAIIKQPDLIILDEAFSGMDDYVRDKCMLFLSYGEERAFGLRLYPGRKQKERYVKVSRQLLGKRVAVAGLSAEQALICVSHVLEEVPNAVRDWLCLPEPNEGRAAEFGHLGITYTDAQKWKNIWGSQVKMSKSKSQYG
ncbi:MAG: hypothetical protein M1812_000655 [Candelaria pacifica]|nr:MAG: hypothetical protein M1812_000655 [Candelaria pacifica]